MNGVSAYYKFRQLYLIVCSNIINVTFQFAKSVIYEFDNIYNSYLKIFLLCQNKYFKII